MAVRVAELAATVVTMARGLAAPGHGTEGAARAPVQDGIYVLAQPPPAVAGVLPGSVIEALVLGRAAGGLVQFASAVGRFALPVQPAPRPGAHVRFAVLRAQPTARLRLLSVQPAASEVRAEPGAEAVAGEGSVGPDSGALFFPVQDLHTVAMRLMTDDPAAAHVIAGGPESTAMAAAITAFLAALESGRIEDWLGSGVRALLLGRGMGGERAAIDRLKRDFSQLASKEPAPEGGDWRLVPLLWFPLAPVRRARLFMRRRKPKIAPAGAVMDGEAHGREAHGGEGEAGRERMPLHFVFEADVPALGPVQLDGLVRGPRFDLMVRTHLPLAEPAREALRRVFIETALAEGGFGTIEFQATPRFPVGDTAHHELGLMV